MGAGESTRARSLPPMRILHINTESGFRGGERQVQLLARGLGLRGHEQLVVVPRGAELADALQSEGIPVGAYTKPLLLGPRSPSLIRWLRRTEEEFRADIVHAHTGNAHTLAVEAFLGRVPIVTTRRVDFPIKDNRASRRKYGAPGQHFIAISNAIRDVLVAGAVPAERIDIVHSGIDVDRVTGGDGRRLRAEWLAGDNGPLIGFIGALVDHKAPWVLARAAAAIRTRLPGARVVMVGDGELRPMVRDIRAASPDALLLPGWRDDIADCYAAFDLFVMPSKLEGLCTALIDALAAGVPCVASRAGGIPDVITDGENGLLVEPENEAALVEAIVRLYNDEPLRARFIESGRQRVAELFTADAMVTGTERVYQRLAGA